MCQPPSRVVRLDDKYVATLEWVADRQAAQCVNVGVNGGEPGFGGVEFEAGTATMDRLGGVSYRGSRM